MGMVTAGGKVVWGRWAQVMVSHPPASFWNMLLTINLQNNPETDGCINA